MITSVKLKNFTAFSDFDYKPSKGVNVLIGGNGTGKTHLLKLLYSVLSIQPDSSSDKKHIQDEVTNKIQRVFRPFEGNIGRLTRRVHGHAVSSVTIHRGNEKIDFTFSTKSKKNIKLGSFWDQKRRRAVYIPVKEMLAFGSGLLAVYSEREIEIEEIYIDIIRKAMLPAKKGPKSKRHQEVREVLQKAISGRAVYQYGSFFYKDSKGEIEFTLLAEGLRKLALIGLLLANGELLKGATLFWDEPEANLNPSMLNIVAKVILILQRMGVQVFIATHNSLLLKELSIQSCEKDKIKFTSLTSEECGVVIADAKENYNDLAPSLIMQAYENSYDAELRKSLGL